MSFFIRSVNIPRLVGSASFLVCSVGILTLVVGLGSMKPSEWVDGELHLFKKNRLFCCCKQNPSQLLVIVLLNGIHNSCTPLLVSTWECTERISPQYIFHVLTKKGYNYYMHKYIRTYVCTYVRTYEHSPIRSTYILCACVQSCVHYIHTYIRTYVCMKVHSFFESMYVGPVVVDPRPQQQLAYWTISVTVQRTRRKRRSRLSTSRYIP